MSYDLQDSWDLSRLENDFVSISHEEWQSYFDYASEGDNWKRFDKKALYIGLKHGGKIRGVSHRQMNWALSVANAIETEKEKIKQNAQLESKLENEQFNQPLRHFTLRVAWHDSAWNGHICKDPEGNRYCSGYHSLLSERLRIDKAKNIREELEFAGRPINEIGYVPPCYWSVNINGHKPLRVEHYNPAAKELTKIPETLQPSSIFSWPFALSFNRTKKQMATEGAYPMNLDKVRIPLFREKIKKRKSIAFLYSKFSNPFTEEERQYLVIGAALIADKGALHTFSPMEAIEAKRKKQFPKNKNFPVINWTMQFMLDAASKVMMPYHEYLGSANSITDSELKQKRIDQIKVAVTEPELTHCFKYVAMDIDDDSAIYILSKMRQKLLACKNDGVIDPEEMNRRISQVDQLSSHCWQNRGYFPGFLKLSNLLLDRETNLDEFITLINGLESDDQTEKILSLLENPKSDATFKKFKNDLYAIKETLETRGISYEQFLQLTLLNLSRFQFQRILSGHIRDFDHYKHQVALKDKTPLEDVCNNPYLLVEEYVAKENEQDEHTGEEIDSPIELFKIDIAYFPDSRVRPKLDIQRSVTPADKRRLRCLIMTFLHSLEQGGHCFEEALQLESALRQYPLCYQPGTELILATDILKKRDSKRDAFFEENESKLKIVDANDTRYYYLNEVYLAERKIGDFIHELLGQPKNDALFSNLSEYLKKSVAKLKSNESFIEQDFLAERTVLYKEIFENRIFILAGGPGSGKSHELLNILKELEALGENYLLLAPTGKAALRLKSDQNFLGIEASTIDKWLNEVQRGEYSREKINRLNNLIIDEMSMVDLLKFLEVLQQFQFSKPSFKRLILVGDPNQLPAIGYGKVLKDILYFLKSQNEYQNNFIELTGNLRSELSKNKVISLSQVFEEKGEPDEEIEKILSYASGEHTISEGFKIVFWSNEKQLNELIEKEFVRLCKEGRLQGNNEELLNQILGLTRDGKFSAGSKPQLDNFQILTPYLSGPSGADGLNDYFQKHFKSGGLELAKGLFKECDKIIRTKNYYDDDVLLLSNGSIGIIKNKNNEFLYFQENGYKELKLSDIRKNEREFFELAYAISVHKSQGSGFDHLFIVIPDRHGLLSKELVYTALTRCRKSVTLFLQNLPSSQGRGNLLELARTRTFTDARKTSLLLNQPFRHFSLEPEPGVFVQSRTELMIYHALKQKRDELGQNVFDFFYEQYPTTIKGEQLKIKTDFTIVSNGTTWYWEHLGRLGNRTYERNWRNLKRPSYIEAGIEPSLLTTDELRGIGTDKIDEIIAFLQSNNVGNEDPTNKHSLHHFSLR